MWIEFNFEFGLITYRFIRQTSLTLNRMKKSNLDLYASGRRVCIVWKIHVYNRRLIFHGSSPFRDWSSQQEVLFPNTFEIRISFCFKSAWLVFPALFSPLKLSHGSVGAAKLLEKSMIIIVLFEYRDITRQFDTAVYSVPPILRKEPFRVTFMIIVEQIHHYTIQWRTIIEVNT